MANQSSLRGTNVCWIGGTRYTNPLNPTQAAKWRLLSGLGVGMFVIGFADGMRPRHFTQEAHFYLLPKLPLPVMRYLLILLWGGWLALWLIFRHGVNVIVTQSPYEGAVGGLVKQIAKLLGKPVALIIENHGDFEKVVFQQRRVKFAGVYRWFMHRAAIYAFHHADALRAISGATYQQLQQWSSNKPIEQFITWTDDRVFRQSRREIPLSQAQDVIYVGVLTPLKGVHFLLQAFAQIASEYLQSGLLLIGKGENPEYAAQLEERVKNLGLTDRVKFLGALVQADLAYQMGRARVLVLPSTSEGLGRVLLEAMLCGTPAIGSRVGGIPELIRDGENGYLVPPGDVEQLADALRKVLGDPHIEEMGERARQFAEQFFSPEAYLEGYRRLLEIAINKAHHTPFVHGQARHDA